EDVAGAVRWSRPAGGIDALSSDRQIHSQYGALAALHPLRTGSREAPELHRRQIRVADSPTGGRATSARGGARLSEQYPEADGLPDLPLRRLTGDQRAGRIAHEGVNYRVKGSAK